MSGKTWLFGQLGDLIFPFTRPSGPGSSVAGTIDNTIIGSSTPKAGTFTNLVASSNVAVTGTLVVTGKTTLGPTVNAITALTTAASPTPSGVLAVGSTAAKTFTLGANLIGAAVDIVCTAGGTASKKVKAAAGVSIFGFLSTAAGSSNAKTSLNFTGLGQAVRLRAMSSTVLQVMSKAGAVASS